MNNFWLKNDYDIRNFEDFDLLSWEEKRCLADNDLISPYWISIWEERTSAEQIDDEWEGF